MEVLIRGVPKEFRPELASLIRAALRLRFGHHRAVITVTFGRGAPKAGQPLHIKVKRVAYKKSFALDVAGVVGDVCAAHSRSHGWWYRGYSIDHLLGKK